MPRFTQIAPDLFQWTDTCNVYVLKDGDAALLIDLGDGSVLDALKEIGVSRVEWVLFTHHHREQCQGGARLKALGAQVAVPALEKNLFEQPSSYRKMKPTLGDAFTVHGASYVRPPVEPIAVNRAFTKMDDFTWRGREIWCVQTGGNSPGHMAYLVKIDGRFVVFSGDLMLDGGKMHTWYDSESDYGFAKGVYELGNGAAQIAGYDPALMLPSHGAVIRDGRKQLLEYIGKLKKFTELFLRGYDFSRFAGADQDIVSRPTSVPHLWQVTPHLYKFRGPEYWVNFHMLLADNGRALLVDCGLFDRAFLDKTIELMKARLGLKAIDAIFVTHLHGDHAMDSGYVQKKYGAKLWGMEGVVDKFEQALDYDLAALLPSYNDRGKADLQEPMKFDKVLKDGATIEWEGYTLSVDWMPGQTKYHSCLHGVIDGKRVAFTGDNLFANPADPSQGGNEAVVARNGGALEEGYLYAAGYLHNIAPDLILGGHCWAMENPKALIERLRVRMESLRDAFHSLSVEDDYRYMFDPYYIQALPYRVRVKPGGEASTRILVRNYRNKAQSCRIEFHAPEGISITPPFIDCKQAGAEIKELAIKIRASADAKSGVKIVAFDITRDGARLGELFDVVVEVV